MQEEEANIWVAASDGDLIRVQRFLQEGVDVNAQDDNGYSPLHAAVSYDHLELVEFLLANGAALSLADQDGDQAIHLCESTAMFDLLVEAGADPLAVNLSGESLHQKLLEDHNDDLLTHLLNYMVKKGLGSDMGVRITAKSRPEDESHAEGDADMR